MRLGRFTDFLTCGLASVLLAAASHAQFGIEATGLIPLNDLGHDVYAGRQGGLYPGGVNMRPPAHDLAGLQAAAGIVPLSPAGHHDPVNGRIVVLGTGMSNTKIIAKKLQKLVEIDPLRSSNVQFVNGAHAGKTSEAMADPHNPYWVFLRKDLKQAGVTREQVQVLWLLQTNRVGRPFPVHAEDLAGNLEQIAQLKKQFFPNLKLMYLSSRIYGGHDKTGISPEPHAYETGFGVKWVIERQLAGNPSLNFDPALGPVKAPWIGWGPYLWADGTIERGDGMIWKSNDFLSDGVHPSHLGSAKAAFMVLDFFHTDATARSWYLAGAGEGCPLQADVSLYGSPRGTEVHTAPRLGTSILPTAGSGKPLKLYARDALSGVPGWFIYGAAAPDPNGIAVPGGVIFVDLSTARVQAVTTNAVGQAWMELGKVPEADRVACGAMLFAQFVYLSGETLHFSRPISMRIGH